MVNKVLDTPIKYLPGVGEKRANTLCSECNIRTYRDLLYYYPYRHIDRTRIYRSCEVHEQMAYIQLRGYLRSFRVEGEGRKRRLVARFRDEWGEINLVWFNGINHILTLYKVDQEYIIFGKPSRYANTLSIAHPEIEDPHSSKVSFAGAFYPLYSTTERMRKSGLHSKVIGELVAVCLEKVKGLLTDTIPSYIVDHYGMLSLFEALRGIHLPPNPEILRRASLRLKFEELFYIRLRMRYLLALRQEKRKGYVLPKVGSLFLELYRNQLPFELTKAQKRVLKEIHEDLRNGKQMNRLLQGDVGSGKTIVALLTMLLAVDNGYQACLMAPTEILSQQHYESIRTLLEHIPVRTELLTGSTKAADKRRISEALTKGEVDILVGTHALIEEYVQFKHLALAIIDEQHRFGVHQRSLLWEKSNEYTPHILIMSATPIPRTLAMTLYGDLHISVIDELPPGRTPIETRHIYEEERTKINSFLRDQIMEGRQVYVVYPLIEESEKVDLKSLEEGYAHMKEAFPAHSVGMLHGKMSAQEKEQEMTRFVRGDTHILVATTVIEVGVNVPNASVMVIENAERFGLSQLHQLRGRVGRGSAKSYCLLVTPHKVGKETQRRLEVMTATTNGFRIAEEDLKLRGHGDIEGTRQSGIGADLRIANLAKDGRIVQFCVNLVESILSKDPLLRNPENAILKAQIEQILRYQKDWGLIS